MDPVPDKISAFIACSNPKKPKRKRLVTIEQVRIRTTPRRRNIGNDWDEKEDEEYGEKAVRADDYRKCGSSFRARSLVSDLLTAFVDKTFHSFGLCPAA